MILSRQRTTFDATRRSAALRSTASCARGWVGWHATWQELVRKRESMRRSLGHMLNRQLSRGWGAWVEMARAAAFMQKLRKGVSIMVNRKLAVGFAAWRQP